MRGSITPERAWWNVLRYDISVAPDFNSKTLTGKNTITFKVPDKKHHSVMQIDLQQPLHIDSVIFNKTTPATFSRDGNAWLINVPVQGKRSLHSVDIFYSGKVPKLEYYFTSDSSKVFYRWTNCVNGFNLPLVLKNMTLLCVLCLRQYGRARRSKKVNVHCLILLRFKRCIISRSGLFIDFNN